MPWPSRIPSPVLLLAMLSGCYLPTEMPGPADAGHVVWPDAGASIDSGTLDVPDAGPPPSGVDWQNVALTAADSCADVWIVLADLEQGVLLEVYLTAPLNTMRTEGVDATTLTIELPSAEHRVALFTGTLFYVEPCISGQIPSNLDEWNPISGSLLVSLNLGPNQELEGSTADVSSDSLKFEREGVEVRLEPFSVEHLSVGWFEG